MIGRHGHPEPVGPRAKAPRQQPPPRLAVAVRVWGLAASGPRPPRNGDGTCARQLARSISCPGGQGRLIPGLCSLVVVAYVLASHSQCKLAPTTCDCHLH